MSNEPQLSISFSSILSGSIARENISRLPCSSCKQNTHVRIRRVLPEGKPLPPVLVVNAGVRTADELDVWRDAREGPNSRFMSGRFRMRRGPEGMAQISADGEAAEGDVEYALKVSSTSCGRIVAFSLPELTSLRLITQAMVVQIQTEDEAPHLVALAKGKDTLPSYRLATPDSCSSRSAVANEDNNKSGTSWHLFNDFLVKPVTEEEVLSFPGKWKVRLVSRTSPETQSTR